MSVLSLVVSIVAVGISIAAYRHATKAFRLGHRPMIRVVGAIQEFVSWGHGEQVPQGLDLAHVILKNIGPASGFAVVAFDPERAAIVGAVDVVEPLGAGENEATRIGRVTLTLRPPMTVGNSYELYCQDRLGAWHMTRFRPNAGKVECTFVGEVSKVPPEVEAQRTVGRP